MHLRPCAQHAAVQREAGAVDAGTLVQVIVHADLDQVRRCHFRIERLVALDQEVPRVGGTAHGRMVEDHVAPAMMRQQAIHGGEIDAGLPVGVGRGDGDGLEVHRSGSSGSALSSWLSGLVGWAATAMPSANLSMRARQTNLPQHSHVTRGRLLRRCFPSWRGLTRPSGRTDQERLASGCPITGGQMTGTSDWDKHGHDGKKPAPRFNQMRVDWRKRLAGGAPHPTFPG